MLKNLPGKLKRNPPFWEYFYNMLSKIESFWSSDCSYMCLKCAKNVTKMVVYSGMNSPAYKWSPIVAHNWAGHRANSRWSAESSHFSPLQQILHFAKMWLLFYSKMARYSTPFGFIKCCQQGITSTPVKDWELFVMNHYCVCSEPLSALDRQAPCIFSSLSWYLVCIQKNYFSHRTTRKHN